MTTQQQCFSLFISVEGNNNKESIFAIQHTKDNSYDNYKFGTAICSGLASIGI